nr:MAG TPA: hypothetical protein [Caudoviricetes sp.]
MKISELIEALQAIKDAHGDQPVYLYGADGHREVDQADRTYRGELERFVVLID